MLEKDVSSQANSENGSEHLGIERKSSSSSRLTRNSARKLGIRPSDPLPTLKPFSETYTRKKRWFPSSTQEIESPKVKIPGALYSRESGVLTRFTTRNRSKLVKPPKVEVQSSLDEIHVTESEAEILREAEIIAPRLNPKRRRRLVLFDSSSSTSGHSTPTPQKEVSSSRRPVTKKGNEALGYYIRIPHTRPKNKLPYKFKLMENP